MSATRAPDTPLADRGAASLLGLLLVLLILGAMSGLAVGALNGSTVTPITLPSSGPTTTTHPAAGTTTTTVARSTPDAAILAACETDVSTVEDAVQAYQAEDGSLPPAGIAWSRGLLQSWPNGARNFTIRWIGGVIVVTPATGTPARGDAGSPGDPGPATGCFAT
jgi:hypothetical protein